MCITMPKRIKIQKKLRTRIYETIKVSLIGSTIGLLTRSSVNIGQFGFDLVKTLLHPHNKRTMHHG